MDRILRLCDRDKGKFIAYFIGDGHPVSCMVSPDRKLFFASEESGRVCYLVLEGE